MSLLEFSNVILVIFNSSHLYTVEIVYNEHQDQAQFARYNRFSL